MNTDSSTRLLFDELSRQQSKVTHTNCLILMDENGLHSLANLQQSSNGHHITVVSNRYDVAEKAKAMHINAYFNDFNISDNPAIEKSTIENQSIKKDTGIKIFAYRVSKEKPVTHHALNQLLTSIDPNSLLLITGRKNDGIKSYIDNLRKIFKLEGELKKHGEDYLATLRLASTKNTTEPFTNISRLNDNDYAHLRKITDIHFNRDYAIYSKPGVFGWNKIDQGSLFLADTLSSYKKLTVNDNTRALDLGCGYGYLSIFAASLGIQHITATDNNAAAILAVAKTAAENNIKITVIADDCGASITQTFDVIFCNPPFHQGFNIDNQLTEKFVATAKKRLNHCGKAYFVTNAFIAIEKIAEKHFASCKQLANNKKFKILEMTKTS